MLLRTASLSGRAFALQLGQVMAEFGDVIPWLDSLRGIEFATKGSYVRDRLLLDTGQEEGGITAYQFLDPDDGRTYVGGLLRFARSPERFVDRANCAAMELLAHERASFVSCLQVRDPRRGARVGDVMFGRAIAAMLRQHHGIWGVVSDPRLLPWYQRLGAEIMSSPDNLDDLWIVRWTSNPAPVRPHTV